jgi:hypothetical protein
MFGILLARIWYALASIPPLATPFLWLGTAPFDSIGDPAYRGLCGPVQGLYGD